VPWSKIRCEQVYLAQVPICRSTFVASDYEVPSKCEESRGLLRRASVELNTVNRLSRMVRRPDDSVFAWYVCIHTYDMQQFRTTFLVYVVCVSSTTRLWSQDQTTGPQFHFCAVVSHGRYLLGRSLSTNRDGSK